MAGQDSDILGMVQDRGMAAEIIKLLGDELRRVQCQITELQSGKEGRFSSAPIAKSDAHIYVMQEENMRLQEELRVLAQKRMETQSQKHCNDSATAGHAPSSEHRTEAGHESDDEDQGLRSKLAATKEKYRRAKSRIAALQESIAKTEGLLETVEREQRYVSEEIKETELNLESARMFSPEDFLKLPNECCDTTKLSKEFVFTIGEMLKLPPFVKELCAPGGFISKNHKEVLWAGNSKSRCVTLSPTHRYDSAANGSDGACDRLFDLKRKVGEEMDMFFMNKQKEWEYVGTYRCVGQKSLFHREVKGFAAMLLKSVINRTTVRETTPAIVQNAAQQMYTMDVIKISCTGWHRVRFNERLARELQAVRSQMTDCGHVNKHESSSGKRHGQQDGLRGRRKKRQKRT